jgi:Amino acid permease
VGHLGHHRDGLTWIYVEPAMMFPNQTGGISLYANEAWRKYTTFVGPIATFGYWIGWSVVLAIFGKIIGDLVVARWFPNSTWTVYDGVVHLGLASFIAIGVIAAVWAFNIFGIRPMKGLTYVTAGLLTLVLIFFMFIPYLTGDWHSGHVHATFTGPWGGLKLVFVWLFILGWSSWACEVCATFAPEYKTQRDTEIAMRSSAIFVVGVFILVPLGLGGVTGIPSAATAEGEFYSSALQQIAGHTLGTFLLICLIASLILSMSSSTADGSRALYGISKGRPDDQAARHAQSLERARGGDDGRPGRQRRARAVHLQQPGHPLHEQHWLRARAPARGQRLPVAVQGPAKLATTTQARAHMDTDCLVHDRPGRLPADRRGGRPAPQRLRDLDRLRHRRRRPARLGAAVRLPPGGAGRREDSLPRGDPHDARTGRLADRV